jgi:hypothetical protein
LPAISVVGDCQWTKRSYGKNYTAKGGCGALIGAKSQKIIALGTKVKGIDWSASSTSMESAIIRELVLKI